MRIRNGSFFSGLMVGVIAGLLTGAIGVAQSATGKKAWERFGDMFQAGYISGFLDCVRLDDRKCSFHTCILFEWVGGKKPAHQ